MNGAAKCGLCVHTICGFNVVASNLLYPRCPRAEGPTMHKLKIYQVCIDMINAPSIRCSPRARGGGLRPPPHPPLVASSPPLVPSASVAEPLARLICVSALRLRFGVHPKHAPPPGCLLCSPLGQGLGFSVPHKAKAKGRTAGKPNLQPISVWGEGEAPYNGE